MLQEVTHTVISLSDIQDEYQPEPQVIVGENTFEAPYLKEVAETDSNDSDRHTGIRPIILS